MQNVVAQENSANTHTPEARGNFQASADPLGATLTEKLMLVLRDGRKLIGVLRSWDQFGTPTFYKTIQTPPPPLYAFFL